MKNNKKTFLLAAGLFIAGLTACTDNKPAEDKTGQAAPPPAPAVKVPEFNADSTYTFIQKQVDFGYRVPNTKAHDACAAYLVDKLKQYCKNVEVQEGEKKAYNGDMLKIKNIFAYFNPDAKKKVLISAHYDSRPWNDRDSGVESGKVKPQPILAANDAGSGVAVILEMARQFSMKAPSVGVILFLNDAEDYGYPTFAPQDLKDEDSYCLGVQYWAEHLNKTKLTADYGILLDMVGAKDARFMQEMTSLSASENTVWKVWNTAQSLGYGSHFIVNHTNNIIDDHVYFNKLAAIPTIDIVDYDGNRPNGFAWYWHTKKDDMDVIDKGTLKAVGQTLLTVIYNEPRP